MSSTGFSTATSLVSRTAVTVPGIEVDPNDSIEAVDRYSSVVVMQQLVTGVVLVLVDEVVVEVVMVVLIVVAIAVVELVDVVVVIVRCGFAVVSSFFSVFVSHRLSA